MPQRVAKKVVRGRWERGALAGPTHLHYCQGAVPEVYKRGPPQRLAPFTKHSETSAENLLHAWRADAPADGQPGPQRWWRRRQLGGWLRHPGPVLWPAAETPRPGPASGCVGRAAAEHCLLVAGNTLHGSTQGKVFTFMDLSANLYILGGKYNKRKIKKRLSV